MLRTEKTAKIEELKAHIDQNTIAIMTQYKGITVEQVTDLRSKLRDENVTFKVFKNTLAKRALDELDLSEVSENMEGPTAWAFCEDPVAPARILKECGRTVKAVVMQGGVLDGVPVSVEQLNVLADLPTRDQLLTQVVGTIAMPLRNLVGVLSALPRNLVNVLDQVRKQKEEAEAA